MHHDISDESGDEQKIDSSTTPPRNWTSEELLDGQTEAIITHEGETYRLRCTRNNKLILHK